MARKDNQPKYRTWFPCRTHKVWFLGSYCKVCYRERRKAGK